MAKKHKSRRNTGFTIPISIVIGFGAGLMHPLQNHLAGGRLEDTFNILSRNYTGYDYISRTWDWERMKGGILPMIIGALVHKFVGGTLGVNRVLGRSKIPFIRL